MARAALLLLAAGVGGAAGRDAGILYEVWHTFAAQLMDEVKAAGKPQLTTERVIRSNGVHKLSDVYGSIGKAGDIYNVEPQGGFYCLFRKRPGSATATPDCKNVSATAERHARMLSGAGLDYVAVDITNWPQATPHTDDWVLRPTEVLAEEWAALRRRGVETPAIAAWPCVSAQVKTNETWRQLLANVYNNDSYGDLIYKRGGKKVVFLPHTDACYDEGIAAEIERNGGRNDVTVVKMWALFGEPDYEKGVWGFFSPCRTGAGKFTTSMVGAGDCNQGVTSQAGSTVEISASGGYMVSQCALPFASPGHMRGLTAQRLFKEVLERGAPSLFVSSFNEHIGGRQAPASNAKIAFNMGLPDDAGRTSVWVDTYGSEFSRDVEPTSEGGSRVWEVVSDCIQLYKAGKTCADSAGSACCSTADKDVFGNVWSLRLRSGGDALLTNSSTEKDALVKAGAWSEVCHPIAGPSVFCVDSSNTDGRSGPFMLYSVQQTGSRPLYRCYTGSQHYFSLQPDCEGATTEGVLGFVAGARGGEMLRALRRCRDNTTGVHTHSLDLNCDHPDGASPGDLLLGYVR
eukprot:TRINITY_DN32827_c0_g1_i1.p1 TRINITY_DN32827_c0_g1~~TRINITY_DN32827_c0_g1_i1.p1  ORF type:complete len:593 (+),score=189.86 TRINITY_DN32827_c0_g1_i1:65-1780(+)